MILFISITYKFSSNINYDFRWGEIYKYFFYFEDGLKIGLILKGVIYTIKLSILILIFSTLIGILIGIIMGIFKGVIVELCQIYVSFMRNVPPIIVMFIAYFFVGNSLGKIINISSIFASPYFSKLLTTLFVPEQIFVPFFSAAIGLALYEAAYISEIIRGGINGIENSQRDAGLALGLTKFQLYRYIILPQAFEKTVPALLGQFVSIVKNTAIASVVAIPELTFQAMEVLASSRLIIEIWLTILILYIIINLFISYTIEKLNIKLQKKI